MESGLGKPGDRISELPDSIIFHILSLLRIRDVISTTFLSRRWNNLWTTVPCLNFTDLCAYEDLEEVQVRNFVNRALLSWKGSKILKFKLHIGFGFDRKTLAGDIDMWVRFAVDKSVKELCLCLVAGTKWEEIISFNYMAPQRLYSCSSLTKLSLKGCNVEIHGCPFWNQLKSLRIDGFCFSEDLICRIMLGCPLLEDFELLLKDSNEDMNIQSTSLKKLKIHKYGEPSLHTKLRIWCPNLKIFELFGILYSNYQLENVSSLSDATLSFDNPYTYVRKHEFTLTKLWDLFSALEHFERVTLSQWCVEVLSVSKVLPGPIPNIKFVKLYVVGIELERLANLLANFPNVKMLVIGVKHALRECTFIDKPLEPLGVPSTSSFPQLRAVEIRAYIDNPEIFQFIVFLLNHCSTLQKMAILASKPDSYPSGFMCKVVGVLLSLQRSYPTTQVILSKLKGRM